MSAELEQLREENLTTKRSLVSLTRVLSSKHHVEALAEDATAEEYIEAVSNMNDTISDLSEDWDAITRRDLPLGAIGSQQATTTQFTIPRLPATLTEQSPEKQTRSIDWYRANFPQTQVKSISERIKSYQCFIDNTIQVSPATGPRGTSTPSCPASTSSSTIEK